MRCYFNVLQNVLSICLLVLVLSTHAQSSDSFKSKQLQHQRVKEAYQSKWENLQKSMSALHISPNDYDIYLRAFKKDQKLEVWIKNTSNDTYTLLNTYTICASSGYLGPKRMQGDGQVPEGFYTIDVFNPQSSYYLSMKVSYPNQSDLILKTNKRAGGDIMVHGNCVTIGCLPMTDDKIKEIYILCVEAKNRQRRIYIDIFPTYLSSENLSIISKQYPQHAKFWESLKHIYDHFETTKTLKKVFTNKMGEYYINKN